MPSRRTLLATGLTFFGTGCVSLPGSSAGDSDDRCIYEARAIPFDPPEDVPREYNRFRTALAHKVIRQGLATAIYGPRPFRNTAYVEHEGTYYRLDHEASRPTTVSALVLSVLWERGQSSPTGQPVVQYASLPRGDRMAIRSAVYGGPYRSQSHPETRVYFSESPVPYPDGTRDSDLAGRETVWVRWDDRVYEITSHGTSTMEILASDYTATRIAADAHAFREYVDEQYITHLEDLTSGERAIIEAAIAGGYEERTRTPLPAVDRLFDRLRDVEFPQAHWTFYIAYEGSWYVLWLYQIRRCAH